MLSYNKKIIPEQLYVVRDQPNGLNFHHFLLVARGQEYDAYRIIGRAWKRKINTLYVNYDELLWINLNELAGHYKHLIKIIPRIEIIPGTKGSKISINILNLSQQNDVLLHNCLESDGRHPHSQDWADVNVDDMTPSI